MDIEELRSTIKYGDERFLHDPQFWERVRGTLGRCTWYMDQAALFHYPEKISIEQIKYDTEDPDQGYGPTHKLKFEVAIYESDGGLREVLNWLFEIDYEARG